MNDNQKSVPELVMFCDEDMKQSEESNAVNNGFVLNISDKIYHS